MPPKCKAPKCAVVSNKCACPNPWVEFLSKNAHKTKMSIADHAKAYRKLKDSGAFKPKPGTNNGPCKTDTVKLCAWKLRRKAGHKDLQENMMYFKNRKADKALASRISDFAPANSKDSLGKAFSRTALRLGYKDMCMVGKFNKKQMTDYVESKLNLKSRGIRLVTFLGGGAYGSVFSAVYDDKGTKRKVAVKIIGGLFTNDDAVMTDSSNKVENEVHNHRMAYKLMPEHIPKLYKAFKVRGGEFYPDAYDRDVVIKGGVDVNILVMEQVGVTWVQLIDKHINDKKVMIPLIKALDEVCKKLDSNRLVLEDAHSSNLAVKIVKGKPRVYILDLEYVYIGDPKDGMRSRVWDSPHMYLLRPNTREHKINMLQEAGFGEVLALMEKTKGVVPTDKVRKEFLRSYGDTHWEDMEEYRSTVKLKKIPYA